MTSQTAFSSLAKETTYKVSFTWMSGSWYTSFGYRFKIPSFSIYYVDHSKSGSFSMAPLWAAHSNSRFMEMHSEASLSGLGNPIRHVQNINYWT